MKSKNNIIVALVFLLLSWNLWAYPKVPIKNSQPLYVMSYNLHNLFDTLHDSENGLEKNDIQFLPKNYPNKAALCKQYHTLPNGQQNSYYQHCLNTDWTDQKLSYKLNIIKKVVTHSGQLPDLLGVVEIENQHVAQMLAHRLGYKAFTMTTSPDERGIDVALFYNSEKLQLVDVVERSLNPKHYQGKPTRNLMVAHFLPRNPHLLSSSKEILAVSVNHWPSQSHPATERMSAAVDLQNLLSQQKQKYLGSLQYNQYHILVMGDFNTTEGDHPHPFYDGLLAQKDLNLKDWQTLRDQFWPDNDNPPGTYFYKKDQSWNKLDRIFFSSTLINSVSKIQILANTFNIVAEDFMSRPYTVGRVKGKGGRVIQIPNAFFHDKDNLEEMGVSDHYPVEGYLRY